MTITFSDEIKRIDSRTAPPYTDGCPRCVDPEFIFAPVLVLINGDQVDALYRHRACGNQWSCCWAVWTDEMLESLRDNH